MIDKGSEPAYPQPATPAGYRAQWASGTGGLTKREHIATEAMKGLLSAEGDPIPRDRVVDLACWYADALLVALEKEVDNDR